MGNVFNEAIDRQFNDSISKLKFDKTIIAKVKGNIKTTDGQILKDRYLVEYSGSSGLPVWGNGGTYNIDDMVYVKIPEGDFASDNKIIEGKVLKEEDALWGSSIRYIPATPVLINSEELYNYNNDNPIIFQITAADNKDIANFEYNANKYGAIKIKFNLKFDEFGTSLGSVPGKMFGYNSQPTIGLELTFMETDDELKSINFTNLSGGNPTISGHQFFYPNWSTQEIIYDIPNKEYRCLKQVKMIYDAPEGQQIPALYQIDNLKIEFVDSIDISAEDNYYVGIEAPNGYFYEIGDENLSAVAHNYIAGKETDKQILSTFWYKYNKDAIESDLGPGWEIIQDTPDNILIHDASLPGKATYTVATTFSDNSRKTNSITFTEIAWANIKLVTKGTTLEVLNAPTNTDSKIYYNSLKWFYFDNETSSWIQTEDTALKIEAINGLTYKVEFYKDDVEVYELEKDFIIQIGANNIPTPPAISILWGGDSTVYKYDANGTLSFGDAGKFTPKTLEVSFLFTEDSTDKIDNYEVKFFAQKYLSPVLEAEYNEELAELEKTEENIARIEELTNLLKKRIEITDDTQLSFTSGCMIYEIKKESDYKISYKVKTALTSEAAINWAEQTAVIVELYKKDFGNTEPAAIFEKYFTFLTDGNNGTNGTNYVLKLEWGTDASSNSPKIIPTIYYLNETSSEFELYEDKVPNYVVPNYTYTRQPAYYDASGRAYYNHTVNGNGIINITTSGIVSTVENKPEINIPTPIWGIVSAKISNQPTIHAFYTYNLGNGITQEEISSLNLPNSIQYSAGGVSPIGAMYDNILEDYTIDDVSVIGYNTNLKFSSKTNNKIAAPQSIGDKMIAIPLVLTKKDDETKKWLQTVVLYKNAYGDATLNAWDGAGVETGAGYILSPTVSAGKKNSDNTFTGVVMGQDVQNDLIGLYGYQGGEKTFSLDETGTLKLAGTITAGAGSNIGGWILDQYSLYGESQTAIDGKTYTYRTSLSIGGAGDPNSTNFLIQRAEGTELTGNREYIFHIRPSGELMAGKGNFVVSADGDLRIGPQTNKKLEFKDNTLTITGTINATSGSATCWKVYSSGLSTYYGELGVVNLYGGTVVLGITSYNNTAKTWSGSSIQLETDQTIYLNHNYLNDGNIKFTCNGDSTLISSSIELYEGGITLDCFESMSLGSNSITIQSRKSGTIVGDITLDSVQDIYLTAGRSRKITTGTSKTGTGIIISEYVGSTYKRQSEICIDGDGYLYVETI